MKRILVTGGAGYIGAHTLVDLIEQGYEVCSIDNFSRNDGTLLKGVTKITGREIESYELELTDAKAVKAFFEQKKFDGIIHFAAFKSVGESVLNPLLYYHNNLISLSNLLSAVNEFEMADFIFSSSCSVYGDLSNMPVSEATALGKAKSPYGRTKQIGEEIIKDFALNCKCNFISLRYFNPVGAHASSLIGEIPYGQPSNVIPALTQFAIGKQKAFSIYGTDYPTPDGTCIRDYVHVCDVARAHRLAFEYASKMSGTNNYEVFNLGSGSGMSVKEIVAAFEKITKIKLDVSIAPRRFGDVSAIYTSTNLALEKLNWEPEFSLDEMIKSAWQWEISRKNV